MGQFACIVYIATVSYVLCCVNSFYINREQNNIFATTSNIMKVTGRDENTKSHYEAALEEARMLLSQTSNPHRTKKQSQLTFIIKPGNPSQQSEFPTISTNHSNAPGIIYIQVPAYVNHSYSLFLHQGQNNTNGSMVQTQADPPINTDGVENLEEPQQSENEDLNEQSNADDQENNEEAQVEDNDPDIDPDRAENEESVNQNDPNGNNPVLSDGHELDGDLENVQHPNEHDKEPFSENDYDHTYPHDDKEMIDGSETVDPNEINQDGAQNIDHDIEGDVNNQSNEENNHNTEDPADNDDCDEDIDETQDFPEEIDQEEKPESMINNENDYNNNDHTNDSNEEETSFTPIDPEGSKEIDNEDKDQTEDQYQTTIRNDINDQEMINVDSNGEPSNIDESIDKEENNFNSENNELGENPNTVPNIDMDDVNVQETPTQSSFDDDSQNTLDEDNPTTPPSNTVSQSPSLKESCLQARGQFASPRSCRKYVNCWDGKPFEHDCPPGLFFNDVKGFCDWTHKVDCGIRPFDSPVVQGCFGNMHGAFRNPNDCSEYFVCASQEPIKFKCPEGLHYNDIIGVCDHRYRVNCGNASPSNDIPASTAVEKRRVSPGLVNTNTFCKPDYFMRVDNDCRQVDVCSSEGRIQQIRCPTFTAFDVKAKKCVYEGTAKC